MVVGKMVHPNSNRASAVGTEEPLIPEFLTTALEKSLTRIGGQSQISKTLTR